MTPQETAERLARDLAGRLDTPMLPSDNGERVRLAKRLDGRYVLPEDIAVWRKLSSGEREWLNACGRIDSIGAAIPWVDSTLQAALGDALIELGGDLIRVRLGVTGQAALDV